MKNRGGELWTIEQLNERVARALADGYDGVRNGRVRDVPDLRTIRYYTTIGLLDRPAAMRRRTALYGRRHLLQLVAVKRLQAQGLSLRAVQERMLGLSNSALGRIAGTVHSERAQGRPASSREDSFWRASEFPAAQSLAAANGAVSEANEPIPLAEGLVIGMAAQRRVTEDDVRVIQMAAAPLIEILKMRGLIGAGPSSQGDPP
jgi:DNA-binding transcriptional MerR regulator